MSDLTRLSRLGLVNAYLVREDDGFTVVDTMIPGSAKGIVREAERAGVPIVRILLTHAHGGRVGSLDDLACRDWRPGTARPPCRAPAGCGISSRRAWRPGTAG